MAKITIEVYKVLNIKSAAYNKYYGRVSHNSTIEASTLCQHAAMDSGIEASEVAVVYDAVLKQIKELLCNGHPIKIGGFGTLKIGISSEGWSQEDVKRRHPSFDPDKEDIRKYLSARQVKEAYLLFTPCETIKAALRGIKFETDKTVWQPQILKERAAGNGNNNVEP